MAHSSGIFVSQRQDTSFCNSPSCRLFYYCTCSRVPSYSPFLVLIFLPQSNFAEKTELSCAPRAPTILFTAVCIANNIISYFFFSPTAPSAAAFIFDSIDSSNIFYCGALSSSHNIIALVGCSRRKKCECHIVCLAASADQPQSQWLVYSRWGDKFSS